MNDNKPSPELLIGLYAASAATVAVASLAKVDGVSAQQLEELTASLEICTARSTGFAGVDQHLAGLFDLLSAARK